jgi:hypothetical protein
MAPITEYEPLFKNNDSCGDYQKSQASPKNINFLNIKIQGLIRDFLL